MYLIRKCSLIQDRLRFLEFPLANLLEFYNAKYAENTVGLTYKNIEWVNRGACIQDPGASNSRVQEHHESVAGTRGILYFEP